MSTGTGWDQSLGRVMILPLASDSSRAGVVLPGLTDSTLASTTQFELTGLDTLSVDLFNQQGLVGQATLHVSSQRVDPSGCLNWPVASFVSSAPRAWRVGLEAGQASGLKLNSLGTMHGNDSSRFVNDALEAANSLNSAGDSVFRGLPFSVKRGSRIDGSVVPTIVAEVVRKINEEANPREEHTLLVAEQPTSGSGYRAVFTTRSSGAEESLETTDVLAAVQLKSTKQAVIVISIDYEDGGKVGTLERSADGTWKLRWKSAYAGC
ncbi:MAG TPA: hypothetical protein VM099_10575 [Gemmatimonadaceae bacterium]|nr:hypothetical protein [Gemmatimonadaceae bacterium]